MKASNQADVESGEKRKMNSELWHACAGPLVSIPPVGSLVVYFPQGHSEQVAASMRKEIDNIPNYPLLPSKLICVLHNVTLHADSETDEVYAQMTLQPVNNYDKEALIASEPGLKQNKQPAEFFCKTLTASDTSTHGGFSVPRRAAEKIFPPLDYSLQPPAQELVAKDLHEISWTLKHIYRGQPKRHLLTTGWSVFVSTKRLLAGDSVLFVRDEKSQLLLGLRRANRQQPALSSSVLSCDSMHIGILAAAAHAASNNSPFTIFYNPRTSPAEFVIPFAKYVKGMYTQVSLGMRFRMMFETEECSVRRHMGTVTGISDLDSARWKNSQWCNLQVGWDESSAGERRTRVSVWEIEPVATPFYMCPPTFFRPKVYRQPDIESEFENSLQRAMPWLGDDYGMKDDYNSGLPGLSLVQWMAMQQNPQLVSSSAQPPFIPPIQEISELGDASRLLNFENSKTIAPQVPQIQQHQHHRNCNLQQGQTQFENQPCGVSKETQKHKQQLLKDAGVDKVSSRLHQTIQEPPPKPPKLLVGQQMSSETPSLNQNLQTSLDSLPNPGGGCFTQSPLNEVLQFHRPLEVDQYSLMQQQQAQICKSQLQIQLFQKLQQQQVSHQLQIHQAAPINPVFSTNHAMADNLKPDPFVRAHSSLTDSEAPSCSSTPSTNFHVYSSSFDRAKQSSTLASEPRVSSAPLDCLAQAIQSKSEVRVKQEFYSKESEMFAADQLDASSSSSFCLDGAHEEFPLTPLYFDGADQLVPPRSSLPLGVNNNICSTPNSFMERGMDQGKEIVDSMISGYVGQRDIRTEYSAAAVGPSFGMQNTSFRPGCSSDAAGNEGGVLARVVRPTQPSSRMRTYTKVQKRGSVGRCIDVTRYKGYVELRRDLARMFGMAGQLEDPHRTDWKLVYVDHEKDILLVGDDPWEEFVSCVHSIKILSAMEVQQMSLEGGDLANLPM